MPIRLEDSTELLQHAGEEFVGGVKGMWEGFTDFALQDNVLEVAVGLMYLFPLIHSLEALWMMR
jgi:large conductance mechanosensitive channel